MGEAGPIEIRTIHDEDGGVMAFYAKGDHDIHEFINALIHYGADDYFEENGPLIENIDWQWWRMVPNPSGEFNHYQHFAKRVPAQGAFLVTAFWTNPIDGRIATRWQLQVGLNKLDEINSL